MPKHDPLRSGHIYELHRRWLGTILDSGGSLINDAAIWTEEVMDEVVAHFVEQPDLTPGKSFRDKLRDQMAGASPEAVQLMAELHIVHFLHIWTGAIGAKTKRDQIEMVLSWTPHPPELPTPVVAAFDPGLIHPGQFALTRRDQQLNWIIEFVQRWLELAPDERQHLRDDPWAFRDFVDATGNDAGDNARLAMLHMSHPETFEAIVSRGHKSAIATRFASDAPGEEDVDRALLSIRRSLEERHGPKFNYYDDRDISLQWQRDTSRWKKFLRWAEVIRALPEFEDAERHYKVTFAESLNAVRQDCIAGKEGWAADLKKTLSSKDNNLTTWRAHSEFYDWALASTQDAAELLGDVWAEDGADSFDRFGAFVGGVPEEVLGTLGERLNIGSVLLMAVDPLTNPPIKISVLRRAWRLLGWPSDHDDDLEDDGVFERAHLLFEEILREGAGWDEPLRDLLDAQSVMWAVLEWKERPPSISEPEWDKLLEFRGNPDADADEAKDDDGSSAQLPVDTDFIARAAHDLCVEREVLDNIVDLLDDKGQAILYGPPGTGKTYLALRLARAIANEVEDRVSIVQFHPATSYEDFIEGLRPTLVDGQLHYELVPGPLVRIAERARAEPDHTFVLVVDEINRANLPKVFGELLLLLEHRNESAHLVHRPDEPFGLPRNLRVIGTMNTADRSIALLDAAMRRRFHFVPFFPHQGPMRGLLREWLGRKGGRSGVADFLDAVNEQLVDAVGDHLLIGPSHFMKSDLSDASLERIWVHNVFPLIEEMFWGDRGAIETWTWASVSSRFRAELSGEAVADPKDDSSEPASPDTAVGGDAQS